MGIGPSAGVKVHVNYTASDQGPPQDGPSTAPAFSRDFDGCVGVLATKYHSDRNRFLRTGSGGPERESVVVKGMPPLTNTNCVSEHGGGLSSDRRRSSPPPRPRIERKRISRELDTGAVAADVEVDISGGDMAMARAWRYSCDARVHLSSWDLVGRG